MSFLGSLHVAAAALALVVAAIVLVRTKGTTAHVRLVGRRTRGGWAGPGGHRRPTSGEPVVDRGHYASVCLLASRATRGLSPPPARTRRAVLPAPPGPAR